MFGFARLRFRFLDFLVLEGEQIKPFEFAGMVGVKRIEFRFGLFGSNVQLTEFSRRRSQTRICIDENKLARVVQKRLLFVLSMDVQEQRGKIAQSRHCARLVIDEDTISFVRRDLPANDQFALLGIQTELFEFRAQIGLKNCFDNGSAFAGAHHLRRSFRAGKQAQSINDNGFSGSRFARKKIEAVLEMKFKVINESKISNAKKPQHTRGRL